jgi:hypothetical protein
MISKSRRRKHAKEYLDSVESRYSFLGKAADTGLAGLSMVGPFKGWAQKKIRSRALGYAMKQGSKGAAGVIGAKAGVDPNAIEGVINAAGTMTGATSKLRSGLESGQLQSKLSDGAKKVSSNLSSGFQKTKELASQARTKAMERLSTQQELKQ